MNIDQYLEAMKIPDQMKDAYNRVVMAGMKIMFSQETHQFMLQQLDGPEPLAQKLGEGIGMLMMMIFEQSNGTLPPHTIFPAGQNLMLQAVEFIQEGNIEVTDQEFGDALEIFYRFVAEKFGTTLEELLEIAQQQGAQGLQEPDGLQTVPNNQPPAQQPQGGLLSAR